mmetsp:Transcript_11604/g.24301  ORF Transcript_11604/g.24301 Transcript_11604/m.24301 type:complete len:175 (-) Transcript_11604:30-554(-)
MKLEDAEAKLEYSLANNATVKFMIDAMIKSGCKVDRSFFTVEKCDLSVEGGFRPPDGVVLCSNHLETQDQINTVLTHELVHAFDHCRAADLDWTNCQHHACSEIRAAILSGDCAWKSEVSRGNLGIQGQLQHCAKRRAELSVAMNPHCKGQAKSAVEAVFDTCFKDTAPFERLP